MFILFCVVFAVINSFFVLKRMKERYESVIVVIYMAVLVGGIGGTAMGGFGDAIISKFLEVESKTEIAEHELVPIEEKSGLYRYLVKNEEQKVWNEINVSNSIAVYAEEGREKPVLREIKETIDYKNPAAQFLFNAKKSRKNTAMIIFPKN